jgi:hypothetical protein
MYLPSCLDGVLVDLVWRLFSNHGICVVGDASPKHKEIRTNEVFGNDKIPVLNGLHHDYRLAA